MTNTSESDDLFLIEVRKSDIGALTIPHTIYAHVGGKTDAELKELYATLDMHRKGMRETYNKINAFYKKNYDDS